jgi:hypothetical protein
MLEQILTTEIYLPYQICEEEAYSLAERFEACQLAREQFMAGTLDFEAYLEILDMADIDVDEYLGIVEENLLEFGVRV